MQPLLVDDPAADATPILFVDPESWGAIASSLPSAARSFAAAQGFEPKPGRHVVLPDAEGKIAAVVLGVAPAGARGYDPFIAGKLPGLLPDGLYCFRELPRQAASLATLAFLLGAYRFERYRSETKRDLRLVVPEGVDATDVMRMADAVRLGRDLVNTPANDLGPDGIEAAARQLAAAHSAEIRVVVGDDLITENFPMVHAVGRASATAPRLIDMAWGRAGLPKITVVGKGVAFDTGGLNIKPDNAMLLMKKDMGGAAAALALGQMIMDAKLPVRLRIIIPAVENAISGSSFRPGDVLRSRKGLNVEIGNTDAEGRLILADALALADEDAPDLLVDYATLTGAARVALGPELPPFYTDDESLAGDLLRLSSVANDPVWRLPLWPGYDSLLESKIADVNHISGGPFAGSITAALFLRRFVEKTRAYAHFDIFAWNPSTKPGRPEGGEVQGARLLYAYLKECFGHPDVGAA